MGEKVKRMRVYHVSPLRRWLLWILIGPMLALLVGLALASDAGERASLLATTALVFLIVLPFHFIVGRTRLALSDRGVSLKQTGYALSARWDEIEALDLTPRREGFITRGPISGPGAARLAGFRFAGTPGAPLYDEVQQGLLAERRLIPIEAFAWHLRRGRMRDDIARFAPHLADAVETSLG